MNSARSACLLANLLIEKGTLLKTHLNLVIHTQVFWIPSAFPKVQRILVPKRIFLMAPQRDNVKNQVGTQIMSKDKHQLRAMLTLETLIFYQ